jgi:hypothetical protein
MLLSVPTLRAKDFGSVAVPKNSIRLAPPRTTLVPGLRSRMTRQTLRPSRAGSDGCLASAIPMLLALARLKRQEMCGQRFPCGNAGGALGTGSNYIVVRNRKLTRWKHCICVNIPGERLVFAIPALLAEGPRAHEAGQSSFEESGTRR